VLAAQALARDGESLQQVSRQSHRGRVGRSVNAGSNKGVLSVDGHTVAPHDCGTLPHDGRHNGEAHPVGVAYPGGDLNFAEDSWVIPDLLVLDLEAARRPKWDVLSLPLLVVEVLSPSSIRQDRFTKRRLYQEEGLPLYWLVDADAQTVEVWTPEAHFPATEQHEIRWHPDGAREPMVIPSSRSCSGRRKVGAHPCAPVGRR